MADQIPIKAVTKANGEFVYAKEFSGSDGIDCNEITFGGSEVYLYHQNVSDNLDVIEEVFTQWGSSKLLHSFQATNNAGFNIGVCDTYLPMTFNQTDRDTAIAWNSIDNIYTVPTSGYYNIQCQLQFDAGLMEETGRFSWWSRLLVDDVEVKTSDRFAYGSSISITSTIHKNRAIRKLMTIEHLNAGEEIRIEVQRKEITTTYDGGWGVCGDSPTFPLHTADNTNVFTIDLLKAG